MNDETHHRQYMVGIEGTNFSPTVQPYQYSAAVPGPRRREVGWNLGLTIVHGVECRVEFTLSSTNTEAISKLGVALAAAIEATLRDFQPSSDADLDDPPSDVPAAYQAGGVHRMSEDGFEQRFSASGREDRLCKGCGRWAYYNSEEAYTCLNCGARLEEPRHLPPGTETKYRNSQL